MKKTFRQVRRSLQLWRARHPIALRGFISEWQQLVHTVRRDAKPRSGRVSRLLIIPSDAWSVVGAKGDDAMMNGVISAYRATNPDLEVRVVVANAVAAKAAEQAGLAPLIAWPARRHQLRECLQLMQRFDPDAVVTLGADVMDGYYNPATALRLLAIADLHAHGGARSTVLGFSFNKQPAPAMVQAFKLVSEQLRINVRDPVSFARFQRAVGGGGHLVADGAFMLRPDADSPRLRPLAAWVQGQRVQDRTLIAVNAHPMLFLGQADAKVKALVASLAVALGQLLAVRPVALVFLSHDDRAGHGDDVCLRPLYEVLRATQGDRLFYPADQLTAAELKAASSLLDGVITGRMHLSIAALGSGVPVAGLTYQDKFEGLFEHFGLTNDLLMSGEAALETVKLSAWVLQFVDAIPALTLQVQSRLPDVLALSRANLPGVT